MDGSFTVAYPDSWEINEEGVNSVSLRLLKAPGPTTLYVAFIERGATAVFGEDDQQNVRLVVTQVAESWGKSFLWKGFKVMDKGVWKGGVYKGYFCEYVIYKEEFLEEDTPARGRNVVILVADSSILFSYSRLMSEDFTAKDYETIETMLETIRVN